MCHLVTLSAFIRVHPWLLVFFGLVLLAASGCGDQADRAEVTGVVLLDGKPMPDALVEFLPDPERKTHGPVSAATTDQEGRFRLAAHDQRGGAVVGSHRVMVQDARSLPPANPDDTKVRPPPPPPSRVSHIYGTAVSTPLREEVKPGSQTVTLKVKGK